MFGFGKDRQRPARRRQVGRALARVASRPTIRWRSTRELLAELGRARRARRARARRSGSRPCSTSTRSADGLRKTLTVAVHRARDAQLEDREPAVVGAVRPDAGVPRRLLRRSRARSSHHAQSRKWQQLLPELLCAPDRAPGARRQDPALPLRAVDPGEVGGAARAVHARAARASSSAQPLALGPGGGTTTIEHEYLRRAAAAARERRQHDARATSNGSPASSTNGARRCGCRSSRRR